MPSTGIRARHSRRCRSRDGGSCNCHPSYEAFVFDRRAQRKIRRTFPTLAEAKGWRSEMNRPAVRAAMRAGTVSLTLRQAAEAWLEAAERGEILSRYRRPYKPSALRGYRADLERYVLDDLGAARLGELTADDFQALVERLIGAGLSGSKIRNVLVPVQALYRRHRRQVLVDPTDGLDLPEVGGRRERVAAPVEATKLLAALADDDRALCATALYSGLRRGELRALRVSDVSGLDGEGIASIRVERSWDDVVGAIDPKSAAGRREVPVPEILRRALVEHVERSGRSGDEFLFGRSPTAPFTPSHVRKQARKAWAAAAVGAFLRGERGQLEPIGLHSCRHSYSSYLDAAGVSETRADRYMGHANHSVANRYRHQLAGQLVEDVAKLDAYLAGATAGKVVPLATGAHPGAQQRETASLSETA
jgi:integrase